MRRSNSASTWSSPGFTNRGSRSSSQLLLLPSSLPSASSEHCYIRQTWSCSGLINRGSGSSSLLLLLPSSLPTASSEDCYESQTLSLTPMLHALLINATAAAAASVTSVCIVRGLLRQSDRSLFPESSISVPAFHPMAPMIRYAFRYLKPQGSANKCWNRV